MLNNKGFAVSSVLYTLLIAFLLFLGAALAQFSTSSSLIGKANDDIVNGNTFSAEQIRAPGADTKVCGTDYQWFQNTDTSLSNTLVKIKSRYGTMYWPKDFGLELKQDGSRYFFSGENSKITRNIKAECLNSAGSVINCDNYFLNAMDAPVEIPLTSESSDSVISISENDYTTIKDTIEKIENYESKISNDPVDSEKISYYTKIDEGNSDIKLREGFSYTNYKRLEESYYDELFDAFSDYLSDLQSANDNVKYEYNSDNYIFTMTLKMEGLVNSVELPYYPVIYKIALPSNEEIIYFDLVPNNDMSSDDVKTLSEALERAYGKEIVISGGSIDMILFKKDDDAHNVFNGTDTNNTILLKEFNEIGVSTRVGEPYYANLRITDNISNKQIELKLYDICK